MKPVDAGDPSVLPQPALAAPLSLWKVPGAGKLACAQLVSQLCDKMVTLGFIWVITQTYSDSYVAWFVAAGGVPHLFLTPYTGKWVSRLGLLRTVIVTDILRSILFFLAFWWSYQKPQELFLSLVGLTLITNTLAAFFNPAVMSLPARMTEKVHLSRLTAMINSSFSIATFAGPALAAVFYHLYGLSGLLLATGVGYLFGGLLESTIRLRPEAEQADGEAKTFGTNGMWAVLADQPLIKAMLFLFLGMNMALGPLMLLMPIYASQIFHGHVSNYSALQIALGGGTVLASLLLSWKDWKTSLSRRIFWPLLGVALGYVLFGFSRDLLVGLVGILAVGIGLGLANVAIRYFFQTAPSKVQVPSVMALVNMITNASYPVSMLVCGLLLHHIQPTQLAEGAAFLLLALVILAPVLPPFRKLRTL